MTRTSVPTAGGLRRRRAREHAQAERACRKTLRRDPEDGEALFQLGLRAAGRANYEMAAELVARAIELRGPAPRYCASLASALENLGKHKQAAVCYQQALTGDPGAASLQLGLAQALLKDSRPAEAAGVVAKLLGVQPRSAEGWRLLGSALYALGQYTEACAAFRHATSLQPGWTEAAYDLGVALSRVGNTEESEAAYRSALRTRADYPEALNNLGNLLRRNGRASEAISCYRKALRRHPTFVEAYYNLGLALQSLDRLEEAESSYRDALRLNPAFAAAQNNLANTLLAMGDARLALRHYHEAMRCDPSNREYRVNLGMAQLLSGDFHAGWRNYAAWALVDESAAALWSGSPLDGRRVLLLSQQGLGDSIQFIRYAVLLKGRGCSVGVSASPALARLFAAVPGIDALAACGEEPPGADYRVPLLHLPGIFHTVLDTIPACVPYIFADADLAGWWAASLSTTPASRLKVGISWAGNPEHHNDRNRSIDPRELSILGDVPDTSFISLQKGYRAGAGGLPFVPLVRELTDLADTAALIANLDLVISVDTAVAHLAGALARPVWTLLPFAPDWRWMLDRTDSPWYPTMRLFRQTRRRDWSTVFDQVRGGLSLMASRRAAGTG
jgi:tetratricopeptide (TPR) repeat protein